MHLDASPYLDQVTHLDVLEHAKEPVAMAGDADIAALVGSSHAGDEAGAAIEAEFVILVEDRHFEFQRRHREHRHRSSWRVFRLLIVTHATRGPKSLVRRSQRGGEILERTGTT
jgi:hypothetical protein